MRRQRDFYLENTAHPVLHPYFRIKTQKFAYEVTVINFQINRCLPSDVFARSLPLIHRRVLMKHQRWILKNRLCDINHNRKMYVILPLTRKVLEGSSSATSACPLKRQKGKDATKTLYAMLHDVSALLPWDDTLPWYRSEERTLFSCRYFSHTGISFAANTKHCFRHGSKVNFRSRRTRTWYSASKFCVRVKNSITKQFHPQRLWSGFWRPCPPSFCGDPYRWPCFIVIHLVTHIHLLNMLICSTTWVVLCWLITVLRYLARDRLHKSSHAVQNFLVGVADGKDPRWSSRDICPVARGALRWLRHKNVFVGAFGWPKMVFWCGRTGRS